jgi:pimeloyl-ACP methyl ester carboxylesterase
MFKLSKAFVRRTKGVTLTILVIATILILSAALNFVLHVRTVDRAALGISPKEETAACPRTIPNFYSTYVSEVAANDHLLYAIASYEAYGDPKLKFFLVDKYDTAFSRLTSGERDGLHYDAYIKEAGNPTVLVAFRGTVSSSWRDWLANLSWFTGLIPVENEYTIARHMFASIREDVRSRFWDKPFSYVATGHSLGGGLAQHVAAGFPCVDAVVFDASFVTNTFVYANPFEQSITIHLYDKGDELTMLRHKLGLVERDSNTYRWYPLKLVPCGLGQLCHPMNPFVIGMARAAVECQLARTQDCWIPSADTRAQDIYCPSADGINDPLCKHVLRRLRIRYGNQWNFPSGMHSPTAAEP